MGFLTDFMRELPLYLLSLPVVLMALSVHESAHGYVAGRLGDPTARNLGRITLNPVKHFDLLGFLSMLVFHIGWAKPVPINSRYFKKPRRDFAIVGAAGPLSNLCLAIINLLVLRVSMILVGDIFYDEILAYAGSVLAGVSYTGSLAFTVTALLLYVLYMGIIMNVILTIFNLIPIPPFDGSRILYAFLPTKWYFGVMKYERIIMLVFIFLFFLGFLSGPLATVENWLINALFTLTGMGSQSMDRSMLLWIMDYVQSLATL